MAGEQCTYRVPQKCLHTLFAAQLDQAPSLALLLHGVLWQWERTSQYSSDAARVKALVDFALTIPMDRRLPGSWTSESLSEYGLSDMAAAQRVSAEWQMVGNSVMYEFKQAAAQAERQAERDAAHGGRQAGRQAERDAASAAAALKRETERVERLKRASKQLVTSHSVQEVGMGELIGGIQRIIALGAEPSDPHEQAVYRRFRWMKVFGDAVFGGKTARRNPTIALLQEAGVDMQDVRKGFHSFDWKNRSKCGELERVQLVDWQHGVQCVKTTYVQQGGKGRRAAARHVDKVVAMCMYFPVLRRSKPDTQGKRGKDVLATAALCLEDGTPVLVDGQEVHMQPFVLTMPHMEMLVRLQEATSTMGIIGLQLMGVHGAGKSHTLEAIGSILAHGCKSDLMMHRKAQQLLAGLSSFLGGVVPAGIGLSKLLQMPSSPSKEEEEKLFAADGSWAALCLDMISREYELARHPDDEAGVAMCKALLEFMDGTTNQGQVTVVILDEVNDLLKALTTALPRQMPWKMPSGKIQIQARSVAECLEVWLEWKYGSPEGVFRILSASPHGPREHVTGLSVDPGFELRPPRADHLAAVMTAAPGYVVGSQSSTEAAGQLQCSLAETLNICDQLGSNMRYSTRCLRDIALGVSTETALRDTQHDMVTELAVRLDRELLHVEQRYGKSQQSYVPSVMWKTCLQNASLTVREEQSSGRRRLLAGIPSIMAACRALESMALQGDTIAPSLVEALRQVLGPDFEQQCTGRIYLNLLSLEAKRLVASDDDGPAQLETVQLRQAGPLVRSNHVRFAGQSVGPENERQWRGELHYFVGDTAAPPSVITKPMVGACGKWLKGNPFQRVVYQTPHQFPGVDIVELVRTGSAVKVRLYEATVSTIQRHAAKKSQVGVHLPAGKPAGNADAEAGSLASGADKDLSKRTLSCSSVWGDLLALCGTPRHTAEVQADGSVKHKARRRLMQSDLVVDEHVGHVKHGTSKINVLLASLGVPLVVKRSISLGGADNGSRISDMHFSVERSDSMCVDLLGDKEDATSSKSWRLPEGTSWELELVYVSAADEARSKEELVSVGPDDSRVSAPFVRYVFSEQLQAVMPL
mgnify:CR=1 FL=1